MARLSILLLFTAIMLGCGGSYQTSNTGLKYKFHIQNQGVKKPQVGEVLYLHYTILNSQGEQLFSTYENRNGQPDVLNLEKPYYKGDYFEALSMMAMGDSATFLINADSFYLKNLRRQVPEKVKKGSRLMFNIRLLDIMTAQASEAQKNKEKDARFRKEYEMMVAYMEINKLEMKTLLPEGIKYAIADSGAEKLDSGDVATIHYIGRLLDGTEFINTYAANQPQPITVGGSYEIEFYNLILPLLGEGEKGKFIIPFIYAFGEMGVKNKVPPFSPVIYDIEVISTNKKENNED